MIYNYASHIYETSCPNCVFDVIRQERDMEISRCWKQIHPSRDHDALCIARCLL